MKKKNELYHHGILGQKWGKKNGPPYPLDEKKHSSKEKKKAVKKDLNEIKKSRNDLIKKLKKVKGIHDDIASKLAYMMFVDVNVGKMYTDKRLKTPLYSRPLPSSITMIRLKCFARSPATSSGKASDGARAGMIITFFRSVHPIFGLFRIISF